MLEQGALQRGCSNKDLRILEQGDEGTADTCSASPSSFSIAKVIRVIDIATLVACWFSQWAYLVYQLVFRPFGWILQVFTILFGVIGTSVMGFLWHYRKREFHEATIAALDADSLYFAIKDGKNYVNGEDCPDLNRVWWWNALFRSLPGALVSSLLAVALLVQIPFAQRGLSSLVSVCPRFREEVLNVAPEIDREAFLRYYADSGTNKKFALQNSDHVCDLVNRTSGRLWYALGNMEDVAAYDTVDASCRFGNMFLYDREQDLMGPGDPTTLGAVIAYQIVYEVLWPAIKDKPAVLFALQNAAGLNAEGIAKSIADSEMKRAADCRHIHLTSHVPAFNYRPRWTMKVLFALLNLSVSFASQGFEAGKGFRCGIWSYIHVALDVLLAFWGVATLETLPSMFAWNKVMDIARTFIAPQLDELGQMLSMDSAEILTALGSTAVNEVEREFEMIAYVFSFQPIVTIFLIVILALASCFLLGLGHLYKIPNTYAFPIVVTSPLAGLDGRQPCVRYMMILICARAILYSVPCFVASAAWLGMEVIAASLLHIKVAWILYHIVLILLMMAVVATGFKVVSAPRSEEEAPETSPDLSKPTVIEYQGAYGNPYEFSKTGMLPLCGWRSNEHLLAREQSAGYGATAAQSLRQQQSLGYQSSTGYGAAPTQSLGHQMSTPMPTQSLGKAGKGGKGDMAFAGWGVSVNQLQAQDAMNQHSPQGSMNQSSARGQMIAAPTSPRGAVNQSSPRGQMIAAPGSAWRNPVDDPPVAPAPFAVGMCPSPNQPDGQQRPNQYAYDYASAR